MSPAPSSSDRTTDPKTSAWVSANAGAGKTYLLTDRVTRLLLSGAEPSRILCLTYTKAAAAEMASRLFSRLGEWALLNDRDLKARLLDIGKGRAIDADRLKRARRLFAQALETPGGLKIQTIHAFCQHLLSRFPVEAKIATRFSVLDERAASALMAAARRRVLERAGAGEPQLARSVASLAAHAPDGRFSEILDRAILDSHKLKRLLSHHDGDASRLFAHMRALLGLAAGEDEAGIVAGFLAELEAERPQLERLSAWLASGATSDQDMAESLNAFLAEPAKAMDSLGQMFLTTSGEPRRRLVTKALSDRNADLNASLKELNARFLATQEKRKAAHVAELTESVVTVALAVLDSYAELKRDRAGLDYDDLIAKTLGLLEREEAALWVLYKLDGGLDHILVDEAQDTSPEQWRIVGKLAEEFFSGKGARALPRTLFAVGDEKQSIFSFQGADPTEFGRQRAMFKSAADRAGIAFGDLRPSISRRSARTILEFVDALFANPAARDGLTSSDDAIRHDPHRTEIGRVEVWPTVKAPRSKPPDPWTAPVDAPQRRGAPAILAGRIASRIQGWLADGTPLPGGRTAIQPRDIMILVRRRNFFAEEMVRQLVERGVPVAGADRMVLMDQIAIADLVALGRFALLPEDDLTLAALLKSPLIGLSESELFELAHARKASLWAELSARRLDNARLAESHALLSNVLQAADFLPPFEFYARFLGKGLRRRLLARLGDEAADAIDEFLALALAHESARPPSLEGFLDWFEKGASEVKRDMEQGGGAVRVMTVHGAKGLEANIVILPDTTQVPDHERRAGILYTDDCVYYGVPRIDAPAPVMAAKAAAQARELKEYRRLLYVAATRAREWLIVYGYETQQGVQAQSWYPLLKAAAAQIGREEIIAGETVLAAGAPIAAARQPSLTLVKGGTRMPAFLALPPPAEARKEILRPSVAFGLEEPASLSPVDQGALRFRRGLLLHALLSCLPQIPEGEREPYALAFLKRRGLSQSEATPIVKEVLGVVGHPQFAPLFSATSRAEVAIAAELPELGHARIKGQIDRLAVTDRAVLIADFKTNRPPPKTVAETPRLYRVQMALYRAGLRQIYPSRRIDCALVWTDGAVLMELPAALLDAELRALASARFAGNQVLDPNRSRP